MFLYMYAPGCPGSLSSGLRVHGGGEGKRELSD